MENYLTFLVNKTHIGIRLQGDYTLEPTLINRTMKKDSKEYISYKKNKIYVFDLNNILYGERTKKYDGILLVTANGKTIGVKTEGFFNRNEFCNTELPFQTLEEKCFSALS
jgi:hypothetical protein